MIGALLDRLKAGLMGEYRIILDLARTLESGAYSKIVVDLVIDKCATFLNLREQILYYRLQGVFGVDSSYLNSALGYLERYFSLLVLNAFFEAKHSGKPDSFHDWIKDRTEIWTLFLQIRRQRGDKLRIFRPVDDLSQIPCISKEHALSGNVALVIKVLYLSTCI